MKPVICAILTVLAAVIETPALALTPFAADYDLYEDGDRIGAATLDLRRIDEQHWEFVTVSEGEGGLAGFLGARITERSRLSLDTEGRLGTTDYRYTQEIAWRDRERTLQIDPSTGAAHETDRKKSWDFSTSGPVLDRHALVLAVSLDLAEDGEVRAHPVAHKGKVEDWRFEQHAQERVETELGNLQAIKLERIRDNKERSTLSWHAPAWKFLPVAIEQIEPDGKRYRMVLRRWRVVP